MSCWKKKWYTTLHCIWDNIQNWIYSIKNGTIEIFWLKSAHWKGDIIYDNAEMKNKPEIGKSQIGHQESPKNSKISN